MSKQISQTDLATIVSNLLLKPEAVGELDTDGKFTSFMTDIAKVVADHCGGEIRHEAAFLDDVCYVGIHGNDSLPENGGIWKDYDTEGEL